MKYSFLTLGLIAALVAACDTTNQCVADCDGSEGGGSAPLVCEDAREDATEFIEENRDCETVLDCVSVDGLCYDGDVSNPCGTIGISASADMAAWQAIADDMEDSCECIGALCGPALMCNAQQQCEASFGSEDFCPSIARDVDTFLAANRACVIDEDCTQLESACFVNNGCSGVVVNVNTSPEDWQRLDQTLASCSDETDDSYCNYVGKCGVVIRCGESGQCEPG